MTEQPQTARLDALGNQQIDVSVANGYWPGSIIARADRPLKLTFHRSDDDPCTERVIFSSPHLDRYLRPEAATTIVLPAQAPGEVRFTCAMGRYRGLIQLTGDKSPLSESESPLRRPRAENPIGMAEHDHIPASGNPGRGSGTRSGWVMPGLLVTLAAGGLVAADVVSLSAVLYAGLLGGMMLMHLGGHGHAFHGGGRSADSTGRSEDAVLSRRSFESQDQAPASRAGSEQRAANDTSTTESSDDGQHDAPGCH